MTTNENRTKTLITVANATQLAASIVSEIVGNEISDTVEGNPISDLTVSNLINNKIADKFNI